MGKQDPGEFLTELGAAAAQVHELFEAYRAAGFRPHEALHLVTAMLVESMRQDGEDAT